MRQWTIDAIGKDFISMESGNYSFSIAVGTGKEGQECFRKLWWGNEIVAEESVPTRAAITVRAIQKWLRWANDVIDGMGD